MLHTTRSHTETLDARRAAPFALAAIALLATAACGDSKKTVRETKPVVESTPVVVEPKSAEVTDTGRATPANASYEDAESAFNGKRYREAVELFTAYTQRKPQNPWGHYMLGLSAWKAGDPERAEGAFEDALELDPRHVKSLINLSRVLLEMDRPDEALTKITAALEIDSGSSDGYRVLGRVQSALGHTDEALDAYRQALAADPEDVWSMNNMGLILIRQGRYDEALRPLARAAQLAGDVAAFQNNLGVALERTGHFTAAAEAYRAALEADSTYTKASVSLSRVEGRTDDPSVGAVDLASLADEFASEVEGWREEEKVAATPVVADSAAGKVGAPVVSKGDSLKPPR